MSARKWFTGPRAQGDEAALEAIEQRLEHRRGTRGHLLRPASERHGRAGRAADRDRLPVATRPESVDEYHETAQRMLELARTMPGLRGLQGFEADDGERVSVITFASMETHRAWRDHPEHRAAQQMGRDRFYASYDISVCEVVGREPLPELTAAPGRLSRRRAPGTFEVRRQLCPASEPVAVRSVGRGPLGHRRRACDSARTRRRPPRR